MITENSNGSYPVYQLGWYPDFSDAGNYLSPLFGKENYIHNSYVSDKIESQLNSEVSELDSAARVKKLEEIQKTLATDLPTIPLLEGKQIAVSGKNVKGISDTLDGSFKFRYGAISK